METTQGSSKQTRVLVVEDNTDAAESLRSLLSMCGFHVMVAHTSQEGLETARKLEPDIVLCDIGLPDSDDRRRALAAGFDQHLVKPVDPRVLFGELQTLM